MKERAYSTHTTCVRAQGFGPALCTVFPQPTGNAATHVLACLPPCRAPPIVDASCRRASQQCATLASKHAVPARAFHDGSGGGGRGPRPARWAAERWREEAEGGRLDCLVMTPDGRSQLFLLVSAGFVNA